SVAGVACITALSLLLSFGLLRLSKRFAFIKNLLIAPMILPTASVIFVWQLVFQNDGYRMLAGYNTGSGFWIVLPVYLLYIWKNTGINIIILSAAIAGIPSETREAAALDGAAGLRLHRSVTLPLIAPGLMFAVVLSFVNALKNFRESYLFFQTDYPPDAAYTVQYYMNNHFRRLSYPNLTAAAVIFTLIIVAVLLVFYHWENKYNEKIY
ncbi:MAG: ABC transporter permease subunit, partial [Oscillospiraceae bacterium]|nr:ABC transporter permease subunit [Oscillospiraceae bacterium]